MITEDYVSFETAKLLKEKGFNRYPLFPCYKEDNGEFIDIPTTIDTINYCFIPASTLQMAMKWLREVHNLCVFVIPATIDKTFRTGYALYPQCDNNWEWCASKNDRSMATFGFNINRKYCDSYEAAAEAAIKYCLEKLI